MTTTFDPSNYNDPKVKETLEMLAQGLSKEEIAEHFGNKNWNAIYIFFTRKGFKWDANANTFVPKEDDEDSHSIVDDIRFSNTKVGRIVRQLSEKQANIRQIAQRNGFTTVEEMGEYMKGQGFVWKGDLGNYEYDETLVQKQPAEEVVPISASVSFRTNGLDEYQSLLSYLLSKKDRLFTLLEAESDGTLPRYKFKGVKANKTLGLPTSLVALLNDFSKEFNVTQRDIIEVALAEFFKKYGYEEQLNSMLQA